MKVVKKMKANQNKLKVNQNEMNEKKREKEILLFLLAYVRKILYLCAIFGKQDENYFKSTTITTFIFQQHVARFWGDVINDNGDNLRGNQCSCRAQGKNKKCELVYKFTRKIR